MDVLHGTDGLHGCTNETVAEFSISLKTAGQAREAKGRGGGWMDGGREASRVFVRYTRFAHYIHTHTHTYGYMYACMYGVCPLLL